MDIRELWNQWEGIHDSEDQKKRLASAKKAALTPSDIDSENAIGHFSGSSGAYTTTLDRCQCGDFIRRKLPCKHMYRLAIELHLLDEEAKSDAGRIKVPKAQRISLSDAVEIIETKLTDGQRDLLRELLREILYISHGAVALDKSEDLTSLISTGLIVICSDIPALLHSEKRNELNQRLENAGISGFKKNMKKENLDKWVLENVSDIPLIFTDKEAVITSGRLESTQRKLYDYLCRRDDFDIYLDPETLSQFEVPKGSIVQAIGQNKYQISFPEDEVTLLLDRYGVNPLHG